MAKLEEDPSFWEDNEKATIIQKEKSLIQEDLKSYQDLIELFEEYSILEEFVINEKDEDSLNDALNCFAKIESALEALEKKTLLSEETDPCNGIVQINAGAGGTESCDWALMLHRMIMRWADSHSFKAKVLDYQDGDSAGIKSSTLIIEGNYVYGQLKSETGIHRLVRISPFDSNARRHTSFASIFVSPEIDEKVEVEIQDKDLKIDVYRSGGAGGQSVNTTDSAVRITHIPTGIIVTCQNERSQLQNKMFAMKILRSRLFELEMAKRREKQNELEASKKEIGWGSQIRSYVLHPYKLVKDHRTNYEMGAAEKVLDGEIDGFIKSFLEWNAKNG